MFYTVIKISFLVQNPHINFIANDNNNNLYFLYMCILIFPKIQSWVISNWDDWDFVVQIIVQNSYSTSDCTCSFSFFFSSSLKPCRKFSTSVFFFSFTLYLILRTWWSHRAFVPLTMMYPIPPIAIKPRCRKISYGI